MCAVACADAGSPASYTGPGALPRPTARPGPHAARRCGGKGDPDPRDEPVDDPTGRRRGGVGACVDGRDGDLTDDHRQGLQEGRARAHGQDRRALRHRQADPGRERLRQAARAADGRRRHPVGLPDARRPASGDGHARQRPGEPGRCLGPHGRATDRGRDPRHRRRPGRRLHPVGVQAPRRPGPHAGLPESAAIPVDPRLDRQDARSARHRAGPPRDRRREAGYGGARCAPRRRRARHRLDRPPVDRNLGPAGGAVGALRPGRRRLRT